MGPQRHCPLASWPAPFQQPRPDPLCIIHHRDNQMPYDALSSPIAQLTFARHSIDSERSPWLLNACAIATMDASAVIRGALWREAGSKRGAVNVVPKPAYPPLSDRTDLRAC